MKSKFREHDERVSDGYIISTLPQDRGQVYYNNEIANCEFFGLNWNDGEAWFVATEIFEANAFTLNVRNVAVVPIGIHREILKWKQSPWNIFALFSIYKQISNIQKKAKSPN